MNKNSFRSMNDISASDCSKTPEIEKTDWVSVSVGFTITDLDSTITTVQFKTSILSSGDTHSLWVLKSNSWHWLELRLINLHFLKKTLLTDMMSQLILHKGENHWGSGINLIFTRLTYSWLLPSSPEVQTSYLFRTSTSHHSVENSCRSLSAKCRFLSTTPPPT